MNTPFPPGTGILVVGNGGIAGSLGDGLSALGAAVQHLSRTTSPAMDLTRRDSMLAAAQQLAARPWQGLVLAAGAAGFAPFGSPDASHNAEVVTVNLIGALDALDVFAPLVVDGGFVLAVTGEIVEHRMLTTAAYTASKVGLSAALDIARRELRRRSIAVIDARVPHTETGFSQRPLMGNSPKLPAGTPPAQVARRLLDGIAARAEVLAPSWFTS